MNIFLFPTIFKLGIIHSPFPTTIPFKYFSGLIIFEDPSNMTLVTTKFVNIEPKTPIIKVTANPLILPEVKSIELCQLRLLLYWHQE